MYDDFQNLGMFDAADADKIMAAFKTRGIRASCAVDTRAFETMTVFEALNGGRGGLTATVRIRVHPDDFAAAETAVPGILGIVV